jgi:GxxExxY protein
MESRLTVAEEEIGKALVNASYLIHKALGPGLLEKVYEVCLAHELRKVGFEVKRQIDIPIKYDGITFEEGLRLDILINDLVIAEIKSVEQVNPVWEAQIISHLKLTQKRLGYLINFNVPVIKNGIKRYINT